MLRDVQVTVVGKVFKPNPNKVLALNRTLNEYLLERVRAPSLFDAIILATARMLNAKVITGDEHLRT